MPKQTLGILMPTPENFNIGIKVGGVADVPPQLAAELTAIGHNVALVSPSYGKKELIKDAKHICDFTFPFNGKPQRGSLLSVNPSSGNKTANLIVHCEAFASRAGKVYINDPAGRPFETDAAFFSRYSSMIAQCIQDNAFHSFLPKTDVIHAHDWPTAMLFALRRSHGAFTKLRDHCIVFTIHNVAYQGIRPFDGGEASSLKQFFPELNLDWTRASESVLADKRWPNCFNLMATAIRMADKINTVSRTYMGEMGRPSNPPELFFGGEGLEDELHAATVRGQFIGILNGCEYGPNYPRMRVPYGDNIATLLFAALKWQVETPDSAHPMAAGRLSALRNGAEPAIIVTSVTRTADQKVALMLRPDRAGRLPLDFVLEALERVGGVYVFLGCGDSANDGALYAIALRHPNFIFLKGFSEACAATLYSSGDLFFMPSAWEPCGLTQMLAMREGQPCLVNKTGGLADTVIDNHNGFVFDGATLTERIAAMEKRFVETLELKISNAEKWNEIKARAAAARFEWSDSAKSYIDDLYTAGITK